MPPTSSHSRAPPPRTTRSRRSKACRRSSARSRTASARQRRRSRAPRVTRANKSRPARGEKGPARVRIEDYGLIGDMQSAALVGRDGSVDWLCLPRFDSASCFAALLGDERHGQWRLAPAGGARASSRRYRPGTLVLESEFETLDGAVRIIDFMPRRGDGPPRWMRIVEGLRGRVPMRMDMRIRPDYSSIQPWLE